LISFDFIRLDLSAWCKWEFYGVFLWTLGVCYSEEDWHQGFATGSSRRCEDDRKTGPGAVRLANEGTLQKPSKC